MSYDWYDLGIKEENQPIAAIQCDGLSESFWYNFLWPLWNSWKIVVPQPEDSNWLPKWTYFTPYCNKTGPCTQWAVMFQEDKTVISRWGREVIMNFVWAYSPQIFQQADNEREYFSLHYKMHNRGVQCPVLLLHFTVAITIWEICGELQNREVNQR